MLALIKCCASTISLQHITSSTCHPSAQVTVLVTSLLSLQAVSFSTFDWFQQLLMMCLLGLECGWVLM